MKRDTVLELTKLDFSEKAVHTYLALLKRGTATVKQIAEETQLNRSSLYVVLGQLMRKGLASIGSEQGVRKYVPASPDRLLQTAHEQAEQDALAFQNLSSLLPELLTIYKGGKFQPKVTVYEGTRGLQQSFESSLDNDEGVMRVFSSVEEIFKSLPEYLPIFVRERLKRGIKMIGIHPDGLRGREMIERVPNNLDDVTFVPRDKFRFPSDIAVYDNVLSFMSHRPPYSVLIESKEIAEVTKTLIDLAKAQAKRIQS